MPTRAEALVGAALSGVLCSGVTAAVLRTRMPDVVSIRPPFELTIEQRALVELLVDPGAAFTAKSPGTPFSATESLTARGFLRGWTRTFVAARQELDAFVLEFATESGARDYTRGIGSAVRQLAEPKPFTVAGVPGAIGLSDARRTSDGRYLHLVALHRGERAALLVLRDQSRSPGSVLLALAMRQYDALAP